MMKIGDFLTDKEVKKAVKLRAAKKIHDKIILPNIARIDNALGQENDPMYLAYMVEYVLNSRESQKKGNI